MNTPHEPLTLTSEESEILTELLESDRAKLAVEIQHTDHRSYRDELRRRLSIVERILERCGRTSTIIAP